MGGDENGGAETDGDGYEGAVLGVEVAEEWFELGE